MFERFTQDARATVTRAQQVAREVRTPDIDSRHLLAALTDDGAVRDALRSVGLDPDDVAARARRDLTSGAPLDIEALAAVGIDVDAVRRRTDQVFGTGALDRAGRRTVRHGGHVPFAKDARRALELALRETLRLHDQSIETRHLLLGMLRERCPAGLVLEAALHAAGSDAAALRTAVEGRAAA